NVDEAKPEGVLLDAPALSPRGIRTALGLNKPLYARTGASAPSARAPETAGAVSWARTALAAKLKPDLA
ncbi:methionine adenosyltransferase, partial [Methylobacterium sp. J-088]|nr:methionine adenosyltransferase [Methylobacterium sp. J-088]